MREVGLDFGDHVLVACVGATLVHLLHAGFGVDYEDFLEGYAPVVVGDRVAFSVAESAHEGVD